ncbi:hypothetical protein BS47DRAFT_273482 [Hydnum rufescens UP504]|uniref:Uncharacterized protein n=1 Tax=Hydnum rufescens UP504 TaxID=1448309 RepID=A0A9P6DME6_9AGAM|nr:hypothetical protein BS47DRAFT_273482 [Hydnum rufescens UP504]
MLMSLHCRSSMVVLRFLHHIQPCRWISWCPIGSNSNAYGTTNYGFRAWNFVFLDIPGSRAASQNGYTWSFCPQAAYKISVPTSCILAEL